MICKYNREAFDLLKKPLVSVLIPNYNYGHYLGQCLDSVLSQTYSNIEVIVRDNASTDNSFEVAMKYYDLFKNRGIYYSIHKNRYNYGSDKNTNLCLEDCHGDFMYVLASDDSIEPTFIEKCVGVLEYNPNVSMVMTHRNEMDEKGKITQVVPFYNRSCIISGEDQAAVFMMAGIAIPGQRMGKLDMYKRIVKDYGRSWSVAGDWYNNFLYAMCGDIAYIKEPLCNYRVHTGNETSESERNLTGVFEHYQIINVFVEIAKEFGMKKPVARYDEAVEKLGAMCLRYAFKMLKNELMDVAYQYLLLAPVFKKNIVEERMYIRLKECMGLQGLELEERLADIQAENSMSRTVSYDPPMNSRTLIFDNRRL